MLISRAKYMLLFCATIVTVHILWWPVYFGSILLLFRLFLCCHTATVVSSKSCYVKFTGTTIANTLLCSRRRKKTRTSSRLLGKIRMSVCTSDAVLCGSENLQKRAPAKTMWRMLLLLLWPDRNGKMEYTKHALDYLYFL